MNEEILKFDLKTNPAIIQLPQGYVHGNRAFIIDEILFETSTAPFPTYLKIHFDGIGFFDDSLSKTTEMEIVPKTNLWSTGGHQYYKAFDQSKDHLPLGITNSVTLMVTDENNAPINPTNYSGKHLVIRVLSFTK